MDPTPSKRPQPPTRITVSGGKRAEPHLMMAHPMLRQEPTTCALWWWGQSS